MNKVTVIVIIVEMMKLITVRLMIKVYIYRIKRLKTSLRTLDNIKKIMTFKKQRKDLVNFILSLNIEAIKILLKILVEDLSIKSIRLLNLTLNQEIQEHFLKRKGLLSLAIGINKIEKMISLQRILEIIEHNFNYIKSLYFIN